MAAIAAETARSARASGDVVSGALLAFGAAALFVGTLFYAVCRQSSGCRRCPPSVRKLWPMRSSSDRRRWPSPGASPSSAIACCSRRPSFWLRGPAA